MKILYCLIIGLVVFQFAGCGGSSTETSIQVTDVAPTGAAALKPFLEDLAASGTPMGSGGMVLQQYVDQIGETDPAKAAALQSGADSLMSENDKNKIKAKAKEMLGILGK